MAADRPGPLPNGCLVFDFDGTILDTEEPLYRSWAELWDDHGHQLVRVDWQQNIGGGEDSFDPGAELEARVGRPLDPALLEHRRLRRDEIQARQPLRAGIGEWLAEAESLGVPVGVASSSSLAWVEGQLDLLGIRSRFATLVCRSHSVPAKPAPTSYRLACARLRADPARSVAVEDSPNGVRAAVAAGLYTVAVPHPLTRDLDLAPAHRVVESLDQLTLADSLEQSVSRRSP
jgi:HAD superfamily hydrolase (TIGR01509 family)